ncbi:MAG: hypothetical protein KAR45_00870 [Desulfobacteraceae bacterium]|nr:hypothetical protein [Desulfobacteraceae bacterium]
MNLLRNRREKQDIWSKSLIALNIFVWILLIIILLIFHKAQPEFETFFDRFYQLNLRTFWDIKYSDLLIYFVATGLFISLTGWILGRFRGRRENDHLISLFLTGLISIILLLTALFRL